MKYYFISILFILGYNFSGIAQRSPLSVELIGFVDTDFSYFNPNTLATTSDFFAGNTAFGGMFKKSNPNQFQSGSGGLNLNFQQAVFLNYTLNSKWSVRLGTILSHAGSSNTPSGVFTVYYAGVSARMFRFAVLPTYTFYKNKKHKFTIDISFGPSIDFVRNDWGEPLYLSVISPGPIFNPGDTLMFQHDAHIIQKWNISLHTGIRMRFELKNANSVGIHIMGGLGMFPVYKNKYTYELNTDAYYTEMLSNGSYLRIGIGYEFQIMKKRFRYKTIN
jgi:hypothetical protein